MTIIAAKAGIMAADSHFYVGQVHNQAAFPKITRGPDGLIGMAGSASDIYIVSQWWKKGGLGKGARASIIDLLQKGNDGIFGIIMRPDASVWFVDERLQPWPAPEPATAGHNDASTFCEGALMAGASAAEAVRLTIKHCASAAGDVQVEPINAPRAMIPASMIWDGAKIPADAPFEIGPEG